MTTANIRQQSRLNAMGEIDKPNVLEDEVFTYRVSKDDKVFIYWRDKQVKIWHGSESRKVRLTLLKMLREISLDVRPSKWLLVAVKSDEIRNSGFVSLCFDTVQFFESVNLT